MRGPNQKSENPESIQLPGSRIDRRNLRCRSAQPRGGPGPHVRYLKCLIANDKDRWMLRPDRHARQHQGPQRAAVGHTAVSSRRGVRRVGHIDRGIDRRLPCGDTCGLLPNGFAIYPWVVWPRRSAIPRRMRGAQLVPIVALLLSPSTRERLRPPCFPDRDFPRGGCRAWPAGGETLC